MVACAESNIPVVNTNTKKGTGYVYDDEYLKHVIRAQHPESPDRLISINKKLKSTGIIDDLVILDKYPDTTPYLDLVHTKEHIYSIKQIPITGEVANFAVSGVFGAIDAVLNGSVKNAFCAIRPPGHHATNTNREEGFCFFNNVALSARYAQKKYNLKKILIIDWDYHHGNGTELAFYDDPSVLFFSTHELRAYPGTGYPDRIGDGNGIGFNINVPLDAGAQDKDMYDAWNTHLIPAVENFKPDLILISAGFDSRKNDTLGRFNLTDSCFYRLTETTMQLADSYCNGKVVSILEGGYNLDGLSEAVVSHLSAFLS